MFLSLRKVLVLEDQFTSPCPCPWILNPGLRPRTFNLLRTLQPVCCVWSHDVHKFGYRHRAWRYCEEWLTYWILTSTWVLCWCKLSLTVSSCDKCCCPWGKCLSSMILEDQFRSPCPSPWILRPCPWTTSLYPFPCPRALSFW